MACNLQVFLIWIDAFLYMPIHDISLLRSRIQLKYLHSRGIRLRWSIRKLWQIFSNERHRSHDRKIDIDFFDFLGVTGICHFSINIRIEVHFFVFIWK